MGTTNNGLYLHWDLVLLFNVMGTTNNGLYLHNKIKFFLPNKCIEQS